MDIIKRLQLNKNPKDIKSGSLIGAKNIMLDPISSSITNEYGFNIAFDAEQVIGQGYYIVGAIPCNEEIVIFLHKDKIGQNPEESKIYRFNEINNILSKNVESNWKWEGGEVFGTFAYNYKNQLIIAISEKNTNKDVPLKIMNLDTCKATDKITYNLEEEIPKFNVNYEVEQKGSLVCGVYTFFIRFLISKDTYTKWFQITDDIIILDSVIKERPKHKYTEGTLQISGTKNILINTDLNSNRSISLNLNIEEDKFANYQIGYVIKHDSDIKGRILNSYNISIKNVTVSNNNFLEETDITNFIEEPNQFYNVKNLLNYNNRLYLSNYSFSKNNYTKNQAIANKVLAFIKTIDIPTTLDDNYKYQIYGYQGQNDLASLKFLYDLGDDYISDLTIQQSREFLQNIGLYDFSNQSIIDAINYLNNQSQYNFSGHTAIVYPEENYNLNTNPSQGTPGSAEFWIIPKNNDVADLSKSIRIASAININYSQANHVNYGYSVLNNNQIQVITDENNHIILKQNNVQVDLQKAYYGVLFYTTNGNSQFLETVGVEGVNSSHWSFPNNNHTTYFVKYEQRQILIDYSNVGLHYNNNRTLIPGQIYNFYVHFVRKDMSVTEGYRISPGSNEPIINDDTQIISINTGFPLNYFYKILINGIYYFYCPGIWLQNSNNNKLLVPEFQINTLEFDNTDFIGFFVTYENVDIVSIPVVGTDEKSIEEGNNISYKYFTVTDYLYNIRELTGNNILETISVDGTGAHLAKRYPIESKSSYVESYKEKHIKVISNIIDFQKGNSDNIPRKYTLCIDNKNIYQNNYKTLYQLTNIVFIDRDKSILKTDYNTAYCFLPGFLNYEKVFTYDGEYILSPVTSHNYNKEGNKISGSYTIQQFLYNNYSNTPINAMSLKQDYDKGSLVITDEHGNVQETVFNSVLEPNKLSDFLELKSAYTSKPIKSYTNYNEDSQNTFDKTIYRSDVISDESLNNGFRHFNIENYKNILENKGNIVNIVSYGLYLLVHTEYSLFVFDRNNQLSENAQLQIPDVFDIDYKELTPSGEGFGGLKNKEESILTKHGYIWFDRISKSIFIFNGEIKPISVDIHKLIKQFMDNNNYSYIRFAEDYISNRLLITLRSDYNVSTYITLSYSFDTNTFISLHDYTFDNNYKTYNNSYLFSKEYNNKLFIWDKRTLEFDNFKTNKHPLFDTIKYDDKICSYVVIIVNDLYETPKTLNSISYILSRNNYYGYSTNIIDQYFNTDFDNEKHKNELRLYSGFKLFICTDLTFSGELDISKPLYNEPKTGGVKDLKIDKPVWNNGVWNFNWFRENIKKNVTNAELEQQNVNQQMKEVYQQHDNLYPSGLEKSDMRSLINGKYFIFRFVFERNEEDLNLRFETLDANISRL